MAIKHLSEEQIRTWSLEQKDRWWLANVWKGDMPQLTLRSGLTGMLIGGILSLTNLYVGAKTGWTLGVGITSVILAFAAFKLLSEQEGIIPALESAHAVAGAVKVVPKMKKNQIVVINISGRGDKDVEQAAKYLL